MTTRDKLVEIRHLLPCSRIAEYLNIKTCTVFSWYKRKTGARNPNKWHEKEINHLHDMLKPTFDGLKWFASGKLKSSISTGEIWKLVIGYEGWYEVSDLGRIKRVRRGGCARIDQIHNATRDKKGYLIVKLFKNKVGRSMRINRIVASAFLKNPHNKKLVHHRDGIKDNNEPSNLEWVTDSENQLYAANEFGNSRGERCGKSKLKESEVLEILKLTKTTNIPHLEISKKFNISVHTVHNISMRRTWKHLDAMKKQEGY